MKNSVDLQRSIFSFLKNSVRVCLVMAMVAALPATSFAQSTSGTVRGFVKEPSSAPAVGLEVTITDTRTNSSRTTRTDENGGFNVGGLAIGGPFTIAVQSLEHKDALVTEVYTNCPQPSPSIFHWKRA